MAETLLLAAATSATTAAGTTAVALPWLTTAGSLSSIAAAGGTAGSIASLAGAGSLLSTGLTAASAFGQIMGGYQSGAVYKAQAQQAELAAKQEELKGREQADKIRRGLQATLASQNAAFAARGISSASGTPIVLGNVSRTEAARDIETAQFGANIGAAALRGEASQYRMMRRQAVGSGYIGAGSSLAGSKLIGSLLS